MVLLMASSMESFMGSSSNPNRWWSKETVAVVTGANRGIGFSLVKRLADLGLTVVLTSRNIVRGQAAVDSLRHSQLPVEFHQLDISDQDSVQVFAVWLETRFGGLDILVNNAGVSFNKIDENSVDHANVVISTNFFGSKRLIERLLPLFRRSSSTSRILNMSSQLGLPNVSNKSVRSLLQEKEGITVKKIEEMVTQFLDNVRDGSWKKEGWPRLWTDYSVSKLALNTYSSLLARRHGGDRISVNCYCPGFTRTDMTGGVGSHSADEAAELAARVVLLNPDDLPTGMFFKWSSKPCLPSKL